MAQSKRDVVLTREALRQLDAAAEWYASQNPQVADDWVNGIAAAMDALSSEAERFPLARENDDFPYELRQMSYGLGKRMTHRVLFVIRDDRIVIHQIRHVAQRDMHEHE